MEIQEIAPHKVIQGKKLKESSSLERGNWMGRPVSCSPHRAEQADVEPMGSHVGSDEKESQPDV